ncbi:MAG: sigma-54-dependent Fis family transcriptional regulator [Deltaproteobacteria bacterium]|nr:sigma-54-dependent Fis family transcriptional regulator [Deltaproteobacteria bacterium]
MSADRHNQSTIRFDRKGASAGFPETVGLTILFHPQVDRVGDIAPLMDYVSNERALVSRIEPVFRKPNGRRTDALASPVLSRKPLQIEVTQDGGISICNTSDTVEAIADSEVLRPSRSFSRAEFYRGIVLSLADRVALLLHPMQVTRNHSDLLGIIGYSPPIQRLRSAILNVADFDVPVLLQGESGVGKELVASAIHRYSRRNGRPYVCVNMSAIPSSLAASELFGYVKGAFSGAERNHSGYFCDAEGGTLFLDEIGETTLEVQSVLLRAIENKKLQPIGGKIRDIDVRVIAATDFNLERAVKKGLFRGPLLQRLSGYRINIVPLRQRRDDIGRLFVHFLRSELEAIGQVDRLQERSPGRSWITAGLVAQLAEYEWPGNVRQLQNVTRQLVISNRDSRELNADSVLDELLTRKNLPDAEEMPTQNQPVKKRRVAELSDQEIIDVLRRHRFNLNLTCSELGVSRNWLNKFIEHCPYLRKAKDLGEEEIRLCAAECGDDINAMAARLEVSLRGLQLQIKRLGM